MGIKTIAGAAICGSKKHDSQFAATGDMKGNYAVSVCDRPKHASGQHSDSVTGKKWSDR